MRYTLSLTGTGDEFSIGSVKKSTWDYIQKTFGGKERDYIAALDRGEVPEEHRLAPNSSLMQEFNDVFHAIGCWASVYKIQIRDKNRKVVFSVTSEEVNDPFEECAVKVEDGGRAIDDSIPYLATSFYGSIKVKIKCSFETTKRFDPSLFKVKYYKLYYDKMRRDTAYLDGFMYDGKSIPCKMSYTQPDRGVFSLIKVCDE